MPKEAVDRSGERDHPRMAGQGLLGNGGRARRSLLDV